jgi:hypothetical protein
LYQGLCGSGAPCWRTHLNSNGLLVAGDWGLLPGAAIDRDVESADLNGDGRDDIFYQAACVEGTCWFSQISDGGMFAAPTNLGSARPDEVVLNELFDADGDGHAELVTLGEPVDEFNLKHRAGAGGWPR